MPVSVQAFLPRRSAYLQLNRSWCKRCIANSHVRQLDLRARHRERFTCRTARPGSVVACRSAMHYPAADSGRRLEVAYADCAWLETHKRAPYVSPRTRFIARRRNEGTLRAFSSALQRACTRSSASSRRAEQRLLPTISTSGRDRSRCLTRIMQSRYARRLDIMRTFVVHELRPRFAVIGVSRGTRFSQTSHASR